MGSDPAVARRSTETRPVLESGTYDRIPDFQPGSLLAGKYRIERELEEGGIGVVLKATHVQLEHAVAIKYLKPRALAMAGVVDRFLREARLAARISSQHAVKVHDVDTLDDGAPYMVMEFLEGRSLGLLLEEEGRIPLQVALDYLLQACDALAEAHAAGIVHRDLKPDNLFVAVRPAGASMLKVLDFGIAKVCEPSLTINDTFGTPAYMSPDRLRSNASVDARADIWALGVVLYELVTGKLPFDAEEVPRLFKKILHEAHTPIRDVWPEVPAPIEAIVDLCLAKDPDERYGNVAELAQDLAQVFTCETPTRVQQISKVIRGAGQSIRPPTPFPGTIPIRTPPAWLVRESVIAIFTDDSGAAVGELRFRSIDEAYRHACSLEGPAVRCDVYAELADVCSRAATYVRKPGTAYWVPVWA